VTPLESVEWSAFAMSPAEIVLLFVGAYLGVGFSFAVAFVIWGVGVIDAATRGTTLGFRVLILPGATALWPLLAIRWVQAGSRRTSP
jgi:hypothetical protein